MAGKNPLAATTRELRFQGVSKIGDVETVQFVEHFELPGDDGGPQVQGVAMLELAKDVWAKAGAPTSVSVSVDL